MVDFAVLTERSRLLRLFTATPAGQLWQAAKNATESAWQLDGAYLERDNDTGAGGKMLAEAHAKANMAQDALRKEIEHMQAEIADLKNRPCYETLRKELEKVHVDIGIVLAENERLHEALRAARAAYVGNDDRVAVEKMADILDAALNPVTPAAVA